MLIVFDFDGPLFDGRAARNKAAECTGAELRSRFGEPRHYVEADPLYDPVHTVTLMYAGAALQPHELTEAECVYRRNLMQVEDEQARHADVVDVLRRLHEEGCELAVLSRRSESGLRNRLAALEIMQFFTHVHGRDTGDYAKPQPEALFAIIAKTRWRLEDTIFVGDDDADWATAQGTHVTFLHAAWTGEPVSRAAREDVQRLLRLSELGGQPSGRESERHTARDRDGSRDGAAGAVVPAGRR